MDGHDITPNPKGATPTREPMDERKTDTRTENTALVLGCVGVAVVAFQQYGWMLA